VAVIQISGGLERKRMKKTLLSFQKRRIEIITEVNIVKTDLPKTTFDLNGRNFYPFRKPSKTPLCIIAK